MKRRDFLRLSAMTAGASLIPVKSLAAEEEVRLDPSDPQAQALQYTEQTPIEEERCDNCIHATGDLDAKWVGCNLFPGKKVKGAGWCNVWAARP
jgi:hypothetical protein